MLAGALSILLSCTGGSDRDDSESIAWIHILSSSTGTINGQAVATLDGAAFVSHAYVAHDCVGLACIFDWFADSYPGVDVSWTNLTAGTQGTALSRYGTATGWQHLWSANVPLIAGGNNLQIHATDPAGNTATAHVTVEYIPPPPSDLRANTDDGTITLSWSPIPYATGYRLYWSSVSGAAYPNGTRIDITTPPYLHSGLSNGTTYYYVITSLYQSQESPPSAEIGATAGAPPQPQNLAATLVGTDIRLTWDPVATAATYSLYWANESGVSAQTGTPIAAVTSPYLHTGLTGLRYFYVVTAQNAYGESLESAEATAQPPLPPPAPTGLTATQRAAATVVDLTWQAVPSANDYNVYRCRAWANSTPGGCEPAPGMCIEFWSLVGPNIADTRYADWTVDTSAYWYYVTARNAYGSGPPSAWSGLCVTPP